MWSRHFGRFAIAIFFGGIHNVLSSIFQLSRGGMDPNGDPKDGGG